MKLTPGSCLPPLADAGAESACPGCFVGGICVASNEIDPANPCQICDPLRSSTSWSFNDGATCDDGIRCTVNDTCSAGVCSGAARECDDGVVCNGVSTCDELSGECTVGANQCGANTICDVESGACVSTCNGCLINGTCIAEGADVGGNPCLICTTSVSTTAPSPALGRSCGSPPSACSGQDTCDAQGRCVPNDFALNTPCGNPASSACDQADGCDANGNCLQRVAANGDPCEDGFFCTVGDRCQGGQCLPTGGRSCGTGSICNEVGDQCQCQGCSVAGTCFAAGAPSPANPCQVCDPGRSSVAFSINANATCGDGQTCDAQGECITVLQQPLGVPCAAASECSSGFCRMWFRDIDGDGHGGSDQTAMLCSPNPVDDVIQAQASGAIFATFIDFNGLRYSALGDDCCDSANEGGNRVFEGNTNPSRTPQTACANVLPFDFDCSGEEEDPDLLTTRAGVCGANCSGAIWTPLPRCGESGVQLECRLVDGLCTMVEATNQLRVCL